MRRRLALALLFLAWLSLAQMRIFERLIFSDAASTSFVVESVRGVLAGTPVSKSWQHRFVAPMLVSGLGGVSLEGVERLFGLTLLAANLVLFALLRRRGAALKDGVLAVACFALARFVLAYKLEYPWDGIDQILFLWFGAWAAQNGGLLPLAPLLLVGTFNHETILYVPLWYLFGRDRKDQLAAIGSAALIGAAILATRAAFYEGQPDLPGQVFETPTPVIGNHLHVAHNLRALLIDNWGAGRAAISLGFLGAVSALVWMAVRGAMARAAVWSLCVIATIVCFGYINETRHYLMLAAFWFAYAWGRPRPRTAQEG